MDIYIKKGRHIMWQKIVKQKKQSLIGDIFKDIFINGIDSIIILFFVTTGLSSAGVPYNSFMLIAISVIILIALIMAISSFITSRQEKIHFSLLENKTLQATEDLKEKTLLENLGINEEVQKLAQQEIDKDRKNWKNLLIQLNNNQYTTNQAIPLRNALITALSYFFGGIIPLAAYFFTQRTSVAFQYSAILSLTILFIFGFFKSSFLKRPLIDGAMISMLSGASAGIAGYFIAKLFI